MKKILALFFSLMSIFSYTQQPFPGIKDNSLWLEKLEKISSKQDQIGFIIEKIKADSIYSNDSAKTLLYVSEDGHIHDKLGNVAACKMIFILIRKKKAIMLDLNEKTGTSAILKHLDSETIDEIKTLKGSSATSLFGIRGNCGVVYLIANDKKLKAKMRA